MKGDLLINLPYVYEEGGGEEDVAFSVGRLVDVADSDGYGETVSGEVISADEGPVDTGDFCTTIDEGRGFDDFERVRGSY